MRVFSEILGSACPLPRIAETVDIWLAHGENGTTRQHIHGEGVYIISQRRPVQQVTTAIMNIFRLLGEPAPDSYLELKRRRLTPRPTLADFSHLVSIFILLHKMRTSHVRSPPNLPLYLPQLTGSVELLRHIIQIPSALHDRILCKISRYVEGMIRSCTRKHSANHSAHFPNKQSSSSTPGLSGRTVANGPSHSQTFFGRSLPALSTIQPSNSSSSPPKLTPST